MGQYFVLVNETKKEYVSPFGIGGGSKLWEWCVNRIAGVVPYLLRRSTDGGSGDIENECPLFAGRWAGDRVYLVGDYDDSELYQKARERYWNISVPLAREYNRFVQIVDCQLDVPDGPEDVEADSDAA